MTDRKSPEAPRLSAAEADFIERMGLNAENDGQARITGRVWGLLVVLAQPLTSATIADLLKVSRGSVSTNLKMLEMLGIIERQSRPGERELYFAMCDQPYSALIRAQADRWTGYRRMIEKAAANIDRPGAAERLGDLHKFYEVLERSSRKILDDLQDPED